MSSDVLNSPPNLKETAPISLPKLCVFCLNCWLQSQVEGQQQGAAGCELARVQCHRIWRTSIPFLPWQDPFLPFAGAKWELRSLGLDTLGCTGPDFCGWDLRGSFSAQSCGQAPQSAQQLLIEWLSQLPYYK